MSEPTARQPEDEIGYLLVRLAHVLSQRWTHDLAGHGVTARQHGVLAALAAQPDITAGALARTVMITPQSMGELLTGLQERGLIDRQPAAGRGHPSRLHLTDDGREVLDAVRPIVEAHNTPAGMGLSDEQAAQLRELLQRVLAATAPSR